MPLEEDQLKKAVKEAARELLEEKWAAVGRWTTAGILSAAVFVIIYVFSHIQGWIK